MLRSTILCLVVSFIIFACSFGSQDKAVDQQELSDGNSVMLEDSNTDEEEMSLSSSDTGAEELDDGLTALLNESAQEEKPPVAAPTEDEDSNSEELSKSTAVVAMPTSLGTTEANKYIVQQGDSLSKIAEEVLGDKDRWQEIFNLNREIYSNPNWIYPGDVILVPGASTEVMAANTAVSQGSISVTVVAGMTLEGIAEKYLQTVHWRHVWTQVANAVPDPDVLPLGMELHFSNLIGKNKMLCCNSTKGSPN